MILIVDDFQENLVVLGNLLKDDTLEIAEATGGQEALDFVRRELPDLILLDVTMPGMDGYEVCRRLKRSPETAAIPVIFLTARMETEDIVQGFEAGAVDYVAKPFRIAELKARVRTHLELHQLKGLLAICSYCSRVCEGPDTWTRLDAYVRARTKARFSHGVCPDCMKRLAIDLNLDMPGSGGGVFR